MSELNAGTRLISSSHRTKSKPNIGQNTPATSTAKASPPGQKDFAKRLWGWVRST